MLAALWQGDLVAALDAVAEDVVWSPVPKPERRGSHRSSWAMAVMGLQPFSKKF
jgi:ketosteroid isomerase-like protein